MNNKLFLLGAVAIIMVSCNEVSKKEVNAANEKLAEAKVDVKEANQLENDAAKAKDAADWQYFKNQADSSITTMENGLKKMEATMNKASANEKKKLAVNYNKAKINIDLVKEKLHQRNVEFDNDMNNFQQGVALKNESFKREFKHDMDELGTSLKDIFKDNVN